jgi:hypothetical protein
MLSAKKKYSKVNLISCFDDVALFDFAKLLKCVNKKIKTASSSKPSLPIVKHNAKSKVKVHIKMQCKMQEIKIRAGMFSSCL